MSKDDLGGLTPIITDMASKVNESFIKEEDIIVTDGWNLDMMGFQRYINIFIMHQSEGEQKGPDNPPSLSYRSVGESLCSRIWQQPIPSKF
jgi:hypothetical protein